ncbi:hypothetical protein FACS1894178_7250 [Bacteroidia bacterium]|nr:hypothetical protein FACS1894178_7250 [Bacteroidia bacterium]
MACYTLSECVLEHLDEGRKYSSALLSTFAQDNNHKIAIDNRNTISNIYQSIAERLPDINIKCGIIHWMYLMSLKPQKWEYFDITDNENDIFLEVCFQTIDKKLIVSSENKCKWKNGISIDRLYAYKDASIKILNKDDAIDELQPNVKISIENTNINKNENTNK